ncbi:hypothetical protein [Actinoplanes sp. URMC 104]|uniref:hypothetical protein n=1 Tax=Actinoplanes sp. URMC 104 TaxID=3423409 RepID=UPI003F1B6CA2
MRIGRILAAAVAVLAVVGGLLTYARAQSRRVVSLAPSGEFAVGRVTDLWVDRSRTDQFAPFGGTPRVLPAWVWYPAAAGATGAESAYAPGAWAGLHRYGWATTAFDRVRTGTRDDVPPAPGPFPVVVLLPDQGWSAPQYAAVASGLAARGSLVVGVTPTYSARLSVVNGTRVVASAAGSAPDRRDQLVSVWAADARFAARRAALQFGSHAAGGRVAYVGHGVGASAAVEACSADGSCAAAVSLDGPSSARPGRPLLRLQASRPAAGGAYVLGGAGHLSFTDYAAFHVAGPLRRALPLGSIDGRRARDITVDYASSFLRAAFAGRTWTAPAYPEVRAAR